VALYVRDCFDYMELNHCDDKVECLWAKMKRKANKADILLGFCCTPPNQDEEVDEIFYKTGADVSQSLALGGLQITEHLLEMQHSREETV